MKKFFLILAILAISFSCKRDSSKVALKQFPTVSFSKLSELFQSIDKSKLDKRDIEKSKIYILKINLEIGAYLKSKYPQFKDLKYEDTQTPEFFIFGLVHAIAEENNFKLLKTNISNIIGIPPTSPTPPPPPQFPTPPTPQYPNPSDVGLAPWVRCALSVIGEYFSIETLVNDYVRLFTSTSAEWSTVWPVLRNTLRRYAGWAIVVFVGYDIYDSCF